MKRSKGPEFSNKSGERVVFFDILRIFFIGAIVYGHYQVLPIDWLNSILFCDGYTPLNIYPLGLTGLSVYGMIFVSGAVLQYRYKKIRKFSEYKIFLFKRFIRLYPAFWISLLFGILLFPAVLQAGFFSLILEFTGFYSFLGWGVDIINPMGWFIGTIFVLYLIFPVLSEATEKYGIKALIAFMIVSYVTRIIFLVVNPLQMDLLYRWFPLCNIFEFSLGILIVQNGWFPRNIREYPIISKLAELSFFVFLFHVMIIYAFMKFEFPAQNLMEYYIGVTILTLIFGATMLFVAWLAMLIDKKIQTAIIQNNFVKQFLNS